MVAMTAQCWNPEVGMTESSVVGSMTFAEAFDKSTEETVETELGLAWRSEKFIALDVATGSSLGSFFLDARLDCSSDIRIVWSRSTTPRRTTTTTNRRHAYLPSLKVLTLFVISLGSTRGLSFLPASIVGQVVMFNTGCFCHEIVVIAEPQCHNGPPDGIL